ncbi:MAG: c-type cytochrome, methanol metabolism-related [Candidatus Thiodiazotropha sp. (ex Lucinoma kastoroae)]|nr:c-type cytochrome, methanol metabolism-related [Candidatus Thiodiazotropha sp. (ex Lucinoma kastoroae)]
MQYSKGHQSLTAILVLFTSILVLFSSATRADYRTFVPSPEQPYYFENGKVDFGTYNGFRRYHADCHVCHGPAGMGSVYAPALLESLKTLSWGDFVTVIVQGRVGLNNMVMPPFAENRDVLANMSDIYAYLKARADGVIGPIRPKRFPKVRKPR